MVPKIKKSIRQGFLALYGVFPTSVVLVETDGRFVLTATAGERTLVWKGRVTTLGVLTLHVLDPEFT